LEALKEAIRQEVAAITPEMILKVMDNYREGLHYLSIFKAATWVMFCSKHVDVKWHSVCFPGIEKNICRIFFGFEFICFSNRGVLSAAPCIRRNRMEWGIYGEK